MTSLIWNRRRCMWAARSRDESCGPLWYVVTKARIGYWCHIRILGVRQWCCSLASAMRFAQSCEPGERWVG